MLPVLGQYSATSSPTERRVASNASSSTRRRLCLQPLPLGRPLRHGAEAATSLDLVDICAVFQERARFWLAFVDWSATSSACNGVCLVAPSHGLPVTDRERAWPEIRKGELAGAGKFDDIVRAAPGGGPRELIECTLVAPSLAETVSEPC